MIHAEMQRQFQKVPLPCLARHNPLQNKGILISGAEGS